MSAIRLNKFISQSGVCSRRMADKLIDEKRVKVNGKIQIEKGININSEEDLVEVDNKKISIQQNKKYIMLNKPVGYVTTVKEQFNRPCVIDLIKEEVRVYPVGRLDMDTSGLLILTNDGEFTNSITHPKNHIVKKYFVETYKKISELDIEKLEQGVDIGGYITKPASVERISDNKFYISISEGKNRQIRRMCEAIKHKVQKLKRISIGKLTLGDLKEGQYRHIKKEELNKIYK